MNLIHDPWLPVELLDGTKTVLGLEGIFEEASSIRDLCVAPHERIACMRLLICITQAALAGPVNDDDLEGCGARISISAVDYLRRDVIVNAFNLYGNGSQFLQLPGLFGPINSEGTPITKLDLRLATGHNPTLLDNDARSQRTFSSMRATMALLTFQCFAPCGTISDKWRDPTKRSVGSAGQAPCAQGNMIHTFLIGPNLLETIRLNLLPHDTVNATYPHGLGCPVWEKMPQSPNDAAAILNATLTYLGRLVPVSRAIRLDEGLSFIKLANGVMYPTYPAFREPHCTIARRQDSEGLLTTSPGRAIWRQLQAVLVKRIGEKTPLAGPLTLANLPDEKAFSIWVAALLYKPGEANIEDLVDASYEIPPELFSPIGRKAYEEGVDLATRWSRALVEAVKTYYESLEPTTHNNKAILRRAHKVLPHFWTSLEQQLPELFGLSANLALAADIGKSPWGKAIIKAAFAAYADVCPRLNPRQVQAFAAGQACLNVSSNI